MAIITAAVIACGFASTQCQAAEESLWPEQIATVSLDLKQGYLDRNGMEWYDRNVAVANVVLNLPKGFRFEAWGSWAPEGDHGGTANDLGDEIDYTLAWSGNLDLFKFDVGASYFDLVGIGKGPAGDVFTPFVGMSYEIALGKSNALEPYTRINWYLPGKNSGFEGGIWTTVGLRHSADFTKYLSLSHEVRLTHDDGAYGLQAGFVGQYEAALCWQLSKYVTLRAPNVVLSKPLNGFQDRFAKAVFGIGADFSF